MLHNNLTINFQFQRRRSAEDEQMMRKYLVEGDLISAEVQNIYQDGSLSLHTRSFTYGKVFGIDFKNLFPISVDCTCSLHVTALSRNTSKSLSSVNKTKQNAFS